MMRLALPAVIDLPAAALLAETLRTDPAPSVLDAAGVERIGVAGLQLLLSAHVTAQATGATLTIEAPSPAFAAAARTVGADILLAPVR